MCPPQVLQVPDLAYSQPWEIVPQVFLRALPAPGHTEGSSLFLAEFACQWIPEQGEELSFPSGPLAFCGDVIFAGSVGRSDLPGGDSEVMTESLRIITKVVHPATRLFPGHGPITTLREEITHNPYFPR